MTVYSHPAYLVSKINEQNSAIDGYPDEDNRTDVNPHANRLMREIQGGEYPYGCQRHREKNNERLRELKHRSQNEKTRNNDNAKAMVISRRLLTIFLISLPEFIMIEFRKLHVFQSH